MKKTALVVILLGLSSGAFAHEVVQKESQGGWTSYRIRCDSGKTRYIAQNPDGFWARGKNYSVRRDAMAAACSS